MCCVLWGLRKGVGLSSRSIIFFIVAQYARHIQLTTLAICKCLFSGMKFIHNVVQPIPPSISRTFSSSQASGRIGLSLGDDTLARRKSEFPVSKGTFHMHCGCRWRRRWGPWHLGLVEHSTLCLQACHAPPGQACPRLSSYGPVDSQLQIVE